jgi:hypothetical protein
MNDVKNFVVMCQLADGAYKCIISLYDNWTQTWEDNIPYIARRGDHAPVNVWIIEQIDTGAYDPISECPLPPPLSSPEPTEAPSVL